MDHDGGIIHTYWNVIVRLSLLRKAILNPEY